MRKAIAVLALLLAASLLVKAQSPGESHSFTLAWATDRTSDTTESIHHLTAFDGQAPASAACATQPYDVWCGSVFHYATNLTDFNFTPTFMLAGCTANGTPQSSIVYTSPSRRTITDVQNYSCTDPNSNQWTVSTTEATNQYRSWCRFKYCWNDFNSGLQPDITGTVSVVQP